MTDVIAELGPIFLGSRIKRLAERLQAGAARVIEQAGLPVQPAHMPLLAALDGGSMTTGQLVEAVGLSQPGVTRSVGQLVAIGLVRSDRGEDQRQRTLSLTAAGDAVMAKAKAVIWPRVGSAVEEMCAGLSGSLLDQIAGLEAALAEHSLDSRVARASLRELRIRDYADDLADDFRDINLEWITDMFEVEDTDRVSLDHPREQIIEPGGAILFLEAAGLGVIGTCALAKTAEHSFELTKMGVRPVARGLKAGEFLLAAAIERAQAMDAELLYLLTNRKCAAAIHLYEKLGFRHDPKILAKYGARYQRCDVAMRYRG